MKITIIYVVLLIMTTVDASIGSFIKHGFNDAKNETEKIAHKTAHAAVEAANATAHAAVSVAHGAEHVAKNVATDVKHAVNKTVDKIKTDA